MGTFDNNKLYLKKDAEHIQTSSRDSAYNGGISSLPESRSVTPDSRPKKNVVSYSIEIPNDDNKTGPADNSDINECAEEDIKNPQNSEMSSSSRNDTPRDNETKTLRFFHKSKDEENEKMR